MPQPSLSRQLGAFRSEFRRKAPAAAAALDAEAAALRAAAHGARAPGSGHTAPDFELPDTLGRPVRLGALLRRGPVVLTFFRGGWCPFCALELRAWQAALPELERRGAALLAVSPETPDRSSATAQANGLRFPLLSDTEGRVAGTYGLAFDPPGSLRALYAQLGHPLPASDGAAGLLPVPGTFVVGRDGRVLLGEADADWRRRPEPDRAMEALDRAVSAAAA